MNLIVIFYNLKPVKIPYAHGRVSVRIFCKNNLISFLSTHATHATHAAFSVECVLCCNVFSLECVLCCTVLGVRSCVCVSPGSCAHDSFVLCCKLANMYMYTRTRAHTHTHTYACVYTCIYIGTTGVGIYAPDEHLPPGFEAAEHPL